MHGTYIFGVGLMMLFGAERSVVLWALLVAALGLTYWETREQSFGTRATAWWLLAVTLVHVPGYLALRIFVAARQRDSGVPT